MQRNGTDRGEKVTVVIGGVATLRILHVHCRDRMYNQCSKE